MITFTLALLVTLFLVSSGRRRTLNERSGYLYRSLWNLKAKIQNCTGKFMCDFQSKSRSCNVNCIGHDKLCDGHEDCNNKADEVGCPPEPTQPPPCPECQEPCNPLQFTCSNGTCIPIDKFCDTVNDCGDMSDEPSDKCATSSPCPECEEKCSSRHYTCDNGNCVPIGSVCDANDDCKDQSDEHDNCGCIISTVIPDTCITTPSTDDIFGIYVFPEDQGDINVCRAVCQALPLCQGVAANALECVVLLAGANLAEASCDGSPNPFRYHPCIVSRPN